MVRESDREWSKDKRNGLSRKGYWLKKYSGLTSMVSFIVFESFLCLGQNIVRCDCLYSRELLFLGLWWHKKKHKRAGSCNMLFTTTITIITSICGDCCSLFRAPFCTQYWQNCLPWLAAAEWLAAADIAWVLAIALVKVSSFSINPSLKSSEIPETKLSLTLS